MKRELLRSIKRRKLRFYGHEYRADGIAKNASVGSTQKSEEVEDLGDSTKITSGNGWIAQWHKVCESYRTGNIGGGRWRLRCVTRTATLGDESSKEEEEFPTKLGRCKISFPAYVPRTPITEKNL